MSQIKYNPLNIEPSKEGNFIKFPMELELSGKLFYCSNVQNYTSVENANKRTVARYTIIDRNDENHIFLIECIKTSKNDFDIRYFEQLEKLDYDEEFMGLVGTSPFGYAHPKNNFDFMEYDKVQQEGEDFFEQEFSINPDEEEDESFKEFAIEDEDGWYYVVDKSTGILRTLSSIKSSDEVYAWIYDRKPEPNSPIFMLIEIKALDGAEYLSKKPKIMIYEGRKLLIEDIEIV
jgi:hypothetical protein